MKKVIKIIGIVIGSIILLLIIAAAYINFSGMPNYEVNAPDLTVTVDSVSVAEGYRMAQMTCFQCHMSEGKLQGKIMEGEDSPFGIIYASNITQHKENGIGNYTDGELAYMFRTGVKRTGEYAPPWMPKFPNLSDKDLNNIIAFLRSDKLEVQPSDQLQPQAEYTFMTKLLLKIAFKPLPFPEQPISTPPSTDKVAFGKYLATAKLDCFGCHSEDFKTQNLMVPEETPGYFGGGNPFEENGVITYSANLTPDMKTGLGNWTENDFVNVMKFGGKPDGTSIKPPMMPYPLLTDDEISAIWAYLQTLPVIENDVPALYGE
jgi:mono/diheme cytochrome c family protein